MTFQVNPTVAARAGYTYQPTIVDDDSVDGTIAAKGQIHEQSVLRSPRLEVQLKASSQEILAEDHVAFPRLRVAHAQFRQMTAFAADCGRAVDVLVLVLDRLF